VTQRRRKLWPFAVAASLTWSVCDPGQIARAQDQDQDASPTAKIDLARELFRQGSALADEAHWAAASKAYEASFALFPHATTLHNIGFCRLQLGELSASWYATTRAVEGTEFPADRRLSEARSRVALQQRAALRAQLATVRLTSDVRNLHALVDGHRLVSPGSSPLGPFVVGVISTATAEPTLAIGAELLLEPGAHELVLEVAGERQTHSLALAAGESIALGWTPAAPDTTTATVPAGVPLPHSAAKDPVLPTTESPKRAPASAGPLRTYGTVAAWSVAGLGLATAAVAGWVAVNANSSLEQQCTDGLCPPSASEDITRYETSVRWVNGGLIAGGLGVLTGIVLAATAPRGYTANTAVLVSPTGLGLVRRF